MRPIIKAERLSKEYRIGGSQAAYSTAREALMNTISSPFRALRGAGKDVSSTIWALKDVSFEVRGSVAIGRTTSML